MGDDRKEPARRQPREKSPSTALDAARGPEAGRSCGYSRPAGRALLWQPEQTSRPALTSTLGTQLSRYLPTGRHQLRRVQSAAATVHATC